MIRADSIAGQIIAVISRRTPAFQPRADEPLTFPGQLYRFSQRSSTLTTTGIVSHRTRNQHPDSTSGTDIVEFPPPLWRADPASTAAVPELPPPQIPARPRRALVPVVLGATAAFVIVAATAVILFIVQPLHALHGTPGAWATPETSTTAPATSPALPSPRKRAASSLARLLAQSAANRVSIIYAVNSVTRCEPGLAADRKTFQQVAESRQHLLSQLSTLPDRSALPTEMLQDLTGAWQADYQTDEDFADWADHENTHGCTPDNTAYISHQAATVPDSQATIDKQAFVSKWNPIASQYSLPTYQWSQF